MSYYSLLNWIGYGICHQIKARTLLFGSVYLPVCARNTGIYLGFVLSLLFLLPLFHRRRPAGLPSLPMLVIGFLFILSLVVDGISSYAGWWVTNNSIRLATGLLSGSSFPLFLYPVFNYQIWKNSSPERILTRPLHQILFFLMLGASYLIIGAQFPLLAPFFPSLIILSVISTFWFVNMLLLSLIPIWSMKAESFKNLLLPAVLALFLTGMELFLSISIKNFLMSLVLR